MKISRIALPLSILALLLLLAGGPGYRLGLWDLGFGLGGVMRYATYIGAAGALVGLVFAMIRLPALTSAIIIGAVVIAVPMHVRNTAQSLPAIHDITTDTENPPSFEAVLPLRADAPNPPEYPGAETASQQQDAYPEIQPLDSSLEPASLFDHALETARDQGWEIVATDAPGHRIEATDTTLWYGFKDDVVIRIRPTATGSRLDMRSKSRMGRSDLGKNAARIRAYLEDLRKRIE